MGFDVVVCQRLVAQNGNALDLDFVVFADVENDVLVAILAGANFARDFGEEIAFGIVVGFDFCDIFVEYEIISPNKDSKKQYICYRKKKAKKAERDGKEIQFITIDDLFSILDTNEEKLKNLDRKNLSPLWKSSIMKIKKYL